MSVFTSIDPKLESRGLYHSIDGGSYFLRTFVGEFVVLVKILDA